VERLAEARLKPAAQVGPRPGGDTVSLRVRPTEHPRRQGRLLGLAQPLRPAGLGPVVQSSDTLSVVADHRIAQCLALHAGEPRGLGPAHALQRVRDRQHPQRCPPIRLVPRSSAQRRRCQIIPDR
jgi:hypothetical protein